jgi:hypothetical protein
MAVSRASELGELLTRLKVTSGRSYESIGRQVHLSKSAVHRYCTGTNVPREFGLLERIALACGADRDDMARLHRLWLRETVLDDGAGPPADGPMEPAAPVVGVEMPRSSWRRSVAAMVGVVTIVALLVGSAGDGKRETPVSQRTQQRLSGPAWTLPQAAVPDTLFGVTINSGTGGMPACQVGAVRFWDGGTRWSEIQRERGEFDWSAFDRLVNGAEQAGKPALFVFGGTPSWANPTGPKGPYPEGTPAPPVDLADWDTYVRAVATRYQGRIEAYELWVLANDRRFYAGSVETLVEMTKRAAAIIRPIDPDATLVCPGMGQLWNSEGIDFLKRFAALGGYDHCDVAGIKLFQRVASDPPETMLELTSEIDRIMHAAGIHPRLWSTGTSYSITLQQPLDETAARNHAVRFYLVGIYARKVNLERMYFYNWGGTKIPIVLQPVGGVPTSAALAVEQLQRWLRHAQSRSCGHGTQANLPGNVWQCDFTIEESGRVRDATILWTDAGTATITAGSRIQEVRRLDGRVMPVQPGDAVTITEEPVMIVARPAPRR